MILQLDYKNNLENDKTEDNFKILVGLIMLAGLFFSLQIGVLETFVIKIIAVNSFDTEKLLITYKITNYAVAAAVFFVGW